MSRNTEILLGDHFDKFIKAEIESGRYNSAREVIISGLRLLEVEKDKIETINEALVVGENSGKAKLFDNEKFKAKMQNRLD